MGHVKTRLALETSPPIALTLYKKLLAYTHEATKGLPFKKSVWYDQKIDYEDLWPNQSFEKAVQRGDGLGSRMAGAFLSAFAGGAKKVVVIGSDCPYITEDIIKKAFASLDTYDAVIGPALDGGYYLIGLKKPFEQAFLNKPWSTPSVLQLTIADFQEAELSYHLLEELSDLDTYDDLQKCDWLYKEFKEIVSRANPPQL